MSEELRRIAREADADARLALTVDCPVCAQRNIVVTPRGGKGFPCVTYSEGPHPERVVKGREHTIAVAKELDHMLHPNGKCHCVNEGMCGWCKWIEEETR